MVICGYMRLEILNASIPFSDVSAVESAISEDNLELFKRLQSEQSEDIFGLYSLYFFNNAPDRRELIDTCLFWDAVKIFEFLDLKDDEIDYYIDEITKCDKICLYLLGKGYEIKFHSFRFLSFEVFNKQCIYITDSTNCIDILR